MTRRLIVAIAVVAVILSAVPAIATFDDASLFDITYAGSLSTDYPTSSDGLLIDGTGWTPATLTWDVGRYISNSNVWRYEYMLDVTDATAGGEISHMIIEVTEDELWSEFPLGSPDMFNLQWVDDNGDWVDWDATVVVSTYDNASQGGSNQGMPDGTQIYGAKFEDWTGDYAAVRWGFDAYRLPVWGDFYAVDGKNEPKYLYNAGLTVDNPTDPPADGSIDSHILRPNGRTPELPPSALLGVTMLPLGLAYIRGRKRKDD